MSHPLQPDPMEQRIIDLVPLLLKLGRTEDPTVIPESKLPNAWDFGVLWQKWDRVVEDWDAVQIAELIKGLTYFEKVYRRGFGSVPPVANIFRIYSARVDEKDRDDLAEWVLANTVNDYCPYGTNNYGARSLAELKEKGEASAARKRATAGHERARFEDARNQKSLQATERLPNALLRKDAMAVAALLAKGAETDALGASGKSAREVAKDLGIEEWLSGKATDEQ